MSFHHPHCFLGFESFGKVTVWLVQTAQEYDIDGLHFLLDIVFVFLESRLLNLVCLPCTVVVVVLVTVWDVWSHWRFDLLSVADFPSLVLHFGLHDVGIPLVGLRIWTLSECSDEFPLEGNDIIGGWFVEGLPFIEEQIFSYDSYD